MKNKTKIILSSILSIILCASLIAGATFALFTNRSEANIAVTSATVKVTASVDDQNLQYYSAQPAETGATMYDENGMGYTQPSTNMQAWTNGGKAQVDGGKFKLVNITPGDKVVFKIKLFNQSNVKIQYRTVIRLAETHAEEPAEPTPELAKVLVICKDGQQIYGGNTDPAKDIIYYDQEVDTIYSSWTEELSMPGEPGQQISVGGKEGIMMSIELPLTVGNEYQNKECTLYFAVEAVQYNASTRNEVVTSALKNDLQALNDFLHSQGKNNTMYEALGKAQDFIALQHWADPQDPHFIGCLAQDMDDFKADDGSDREFAWDSENDQFLLMKGDNVIYPTTGVTTSKVAIFKLANALNASENNGYSLYLTSDYNGGASPLKVATGLDVGVNTGITSITYERSEQPAQSVIIRTNSYGTALTVNAPNDTIRHYNVAGSVNVKAAATASYHEYGNVPFVEIAKGRIALEKGAEVTNLHFHATEQKDFDNIIVSYAKDDNVVLPAFSRDEANIKTTGTLVVELQDTTNLEHHDSDYIWLYKQGVISQIVVSNNKITGIEKDATTGALKGAIVESTEYETLYLGVANEVKPTPQATQKAAVEIANNYSGSHGTTGTIGGKEVKVAELDENDDIMPEGEKTLEQTIQEVIDEGGKTSEEVKKNSILKVYNSVEALGDGETFQFVFDGENVVWTSSDTTYATVNNKGLVTVVNGCGEVTITATIGDQSFSCDIITTYFHNGNWEWSFSDQTEPSEIANAKQWVNMIYAGEYGYGSGWAGYTFGAFKLINDIDLSGVELPATSNSKYIYSYGFYLDGNNKTVKNGNGITLFGGKQNGTSISSIYYYAGEAKIKNLKVDGFEADMSLFGMPYSGSNVTFENVDVTNCTAYLGLYCDQIWSGSPVVNWIDCDINNCTVKGGYSGVAVFAGYLYKDSKMNISGCTIENTEVIASSGPAAGIVAQNNSAAANVVVTNTSFSADCIITAAGAGATAAAFDASHDTNYASDKSNSFLGIITSDSKKVLNGFESSIYQQYSSLKASDFVIDGDGYITYNGDKTFDKITIGEFGTRVGYHSTPTSIGYTEGGMNFFWSPSVEKEIDDTTAKLYKLSLVEHIVNVTSEAYKDKLGSSIVDDGSIDWQGRDAYYDSISHTIYFKSKMSSDADCMFVSGSASVDKEGNITAINNFTYTIYVNISLYNGDEFVGSARLAYSFNQSNQ